MAANTNDFVQWAGIDSANVLSPAAYASLAKRPIGFQAGITKSIELNTVLRQASFVASAIAQFMQEFGPGDVNDDGNISEFVGNLVGALGALFASKNATTILADTGTADALVLTPAVALTSYAAGQSFWITKGGSPNATTTPTIAISGLLAKTIVRRDGTAIVAGDLAAALDFFVYYDGTNFRVLTPMLASELNAAIVIDAPLAMAPLLPRFHGGLTLSNDLTSPNTVIDVAPGAATSDDFTTMIQLVSAFSKTISGTFVAGNGGPGLDTGVVATSAWYHVHLIKGTAGVDLLISLSPTSPLMPTGFTKHRRIGSFVTDSSSHIWPFVNVGSWFFVKTTLLSTSAVAQSATPGNRVAFVPLGVSVMARIIAINAAGAAGHSLWVYSPLVSDEAASSTEATIKSTSADTVFSQVDVLTDTNANVRSVCDGATGTFSIRSIGWCELGRA